MSYRLMVAGFIDKDVFPTLEAADAKAEELGADAVVQVQVLRKYPRIFTEKERNLLYSEVDFGEYASNHLCGNGLERDIAESEVYKMTDDELVDTLIENEYYPPFLDDDEVRTAEDAIRAAVAKHAPDKVEAAVAAWRASL